MRYAMIPALVAGSFLATAAVAEDALPLTDAQLDGVNAGAFASAAGLSTTLGDLLSETTSSSSVIAIAGSAAAATNTTIGIATSTFFGAQSSSASQSAATLP